MRLALLTPVFAPDLYYLSALLQADRVVMLDTLKFSRKSRVHRAKIRTPEGFQWINIPVRTEDRSRPIREVRMDHSENWITPIMRSLRYNYRNSLYFDFYEPEIEADFNQALNFEHLLDFTNYFRNRLFTYLYIARRIEWANEIEVFDENPDVFAQHIGADVVFQESDSRHYQRQSSLRKDPDFTHPVYDQHFEGFVPDCCLLDLLFQYGPTSYKIIDQLSS